MIHYRFATIEQEGEGIVSGTAVKYGDRATFYTKSGRKVYEVIEPGALQIPESGVRLTLTHDQTKVLGHTRSNLEVKQTDEGVTFRADLNGTSLGREAVEMVKNNFLGGASVEMLIHEEKYRGGMIHIQKATLGGIGLVDSPAYPESQIEARSVIIERLTDNEIVRLWL